MNEVSITENINAVEVFKTGGTDEIITKIREQALSFVPDVSTTKGRQSIASVANRVARSKTALDKAGKELVAGIKEQAKVIDAERKKMRDELDTLKAEVRKPLTDWEDEQKRIAEKEAERLRLEEEAKQRAIFEAEEKKRIELEKKEAELKAREDALLEEERKKEAEQERIKREENIRQDAIREAEANAKEEQDRILAEEKRRSEDKENRRLVNQSILSIFTDEGCSEDTAKAIIKRILSNENHNIKITY